MDQHIVGLLSFSKKPLEKINQTGLNPTEPCIAKLTALQRTDQYLNFGSVAQSERKYQSGRADTKEGQILVERKAESSCLVSFRPRLDCHHHLHFTLPPFQDSKPQPLFQFSQFETEKVFDTVQILGGGRTEETATNIATLSGSLDLQSKSFTSASNFMIIKFRSDEAVEKKGFHASWTTSTEGQSCGGDRTALPSPQILASPGYDGRSEYPGGLECLHVIKAPQGQIITLEIEDFEMEPDNDFVLIRDGEEPDSPALVTLTGQMSDNPQFVVSTGNR